MSLTIDPAPQSGPVTAGYLRFLAAFRDGLVKPGEVVTQQDLCRILGLSLTPLRECLVLLEDYGLVEVRPRSGIRIVYPEISFFRENMQFRTIIEARAVARHAEDADPAPVAALRRDHLDCLLRLQSDEDLATIKPAMRTLDQVLHAAIVAALHNRAITAAHARLQDNLSIAKQVHQQAVFRRQLIETVNEHVAILDAVLARDPAAAVRALESHLRSSTHRTFT